MRRPSTWLVTTTATDAHGHERVLLGRAVYDHDSDTLAVATFDRPRREEVTQGGHGQLEPLAKQLLRELHRSGRVSGGKG
jgi:hypothetical protein